MKLTPAAIGIAFTLLFHGLTPAAGQAPADGERPAAPGGELQILGQDGRALGGCPLKHTEVRADVVGFLARVKVKQTFHNPTGQKIEAVYVFPLPHDGAVDDMVMTVGDRRVVGQVKKREEARQAYEQAREAGQIAGLLDQERPNVFTQSVANIEPGAQVVVEIVYVQTLKYEDGSFEFVFPTVVGPRYVPGSPTGSDGPGFAPDTTQVPDASRITPPVTPQGTRAGHDIGLTVSIDAGMPIGDVECRSHQVDVNRAGPGRAVVSLKNQETIPNKDFVLRYRTASDQIGDAFLTHKDERGSFFTLILQPPERVERKQAVGRELIFVLDTSGSMNGFPVAKAKYVMGLAIDSMGPQDAFNLITFSGDTHVLWDKPRPNTRANRDEAQNFLQSRQGRGGTEMMKAIEAALLQPRALKPIREMPPEDAAPDPIRIVCFMTDGYVGNDFEIIDAVKKHAGTTRVFSFGIGNSVNRFLLDGMAHAGRGAAEYVLLESQGDSAAKRFHERIDAPVLTDVAIDWGGLPVADVYPAAVPDLFSSKPVVVHGRLKGEIKAGDPAAHIILRGDTATGVTERKIQVTPAPADASHEAMASLWARAKVGDLMRRDLKALQAGSFPDELKNEVTALGVEFRLMTQFTSFVAVEEMTVTKGGKPTKITVPVEMPEGVSYEGVFGGQGRGLGLGRHPGQQPAAATELSALGRSATVRGDGSRPAAPGRAQAAGAAGVGAAGVAPRAAEKRLRELNQRASGDEEAEASPHRRAPRKETAGGAEPAPSEPAATTGVDPNAAAADAPAPASDAPSDSDGKLDPALRGLAEKVAREGQQGTLTAGVLSVVDYKLDVIVTLSNLSETTREALKRLGFEQSAESKTVRLLVGTVDVRKLAELTKLDAVLSVKPVGD